LDLDDLGAFRAPVVDKHYNGGFFLPNNQSLQDADIEYICKVVRKTSQRGLG